MFWGWIHARRWCKSTRINPLTSAKRASVNEGRTELSCHWPRPKARVPKPLHTSCFCNFLSWAPEVQHELDSYSLAYTPVLELSRAQHPAGAQDGFLFNNSAILSPSLPQHFKGPENHTLFMASNNNKSPAAPSWRCFYRSHTLPRSGSLSQSLRSKQEQPAHPMPSTQDESISRRLPRPQIFFCPSTFPSDKPGGTSTSPRPVRMNHLHGHNPLGST